MCLKSYPIFYPLILILLLACNATSNQDQADTDTEEKPLNFILIYTDELQFSDITSYGGKFPTPNIDQLAAEGVRFMQAHTTASMCTPSRFSVMTGQMAGRCIAEGFVKAFPKTAPYSIAWNTHIEASNATLPRLLAKQGYYTGMSGKWHIGQLPKELAIPTLQKDDDIKDAEVEAKLKQRHDMIADYLKSSAGFQEARSVLWGNFDGFPVKALQYHNIPWITKGGIEFIASAQEKEKPFFLYIAPTAIHGPNHVENLTEDLRYTLEGYLPEVTKYQPDSLQLITDASQYNVSESHRFAGITHIDHQVGELINHLKANDLYDNTAIIFMADHNIEPGKATCYEKGTNVPMIVRWPGKQQGIVNQNALVQNTDILPTLIAATGTTDLPQPLDGYSLLPILNRETAQIRDYVFAEAGYARSVYDGNYKYIALRFPEEVNEQIRKGSLLKAPNHLNVPKQAHSRIAINHFPDYFDGDQLYDLKKDPYEQQNLAADGAYVEKMQQLQAALKVHLATIPYPFNLDDKTLESLSYQKLSTNAKDQNTVADIVWFTRDHGEFVWPPEGE